jgi:hypothetical protein
VLCTDLAGLDCSHLAGQPPACAQGSGTGVDADAPDCLCCSTFEAAADLVFPVALHAGTTSETAAAAVADGVLPLPYRPPLSRR